MNKKLLIISGITASGKSDLALNLSKSLNGIIINADSIQLYKGLPTLSAQPNNNDLIIAEHKLYSCLSPYESNSVFDWINMAIKEIENAFLVKKIPIVVGGTGMYISRLINGIRNAPSTNEDLRCELDDLYSKIGWDEFLKIVEKVDPESVAKLERNDKQRLIRVYEIYKLSGQKASDLENKPNKMFFERENIFHINIMPERNIIYTKCKNRFKNILNEAINEVKIFINNYPKIFDKYYTIQNTIGLIQIKKYLNNELNFEEMLESSLKETRHYAKRQYTWFKNQFKSVDFLFNEIPNITNINNLLKKISGFL